MLISVVCMENVWEMFWGNFSGTGPGVGVPGWGPIPCPPSLAGWMTEWQAGRVGASPVGRLGSQLPLGWGKVGAYPDWLGEQGPRLGIRVPGSQLEP